MADGAEPGLPLHALPRPLRLAIRFGHRLMRGDVTPPRRLGLAAAFGFLAATGAYGTWVGGHMPGLVAETGNRAGLTVDSIRITGHERTTKDEVLAALAFGDTPSIVGLDVDAARNRLLALPWIATASVAKALPGSVSVEITEKQAVAIWQNGTEVVVLDEAGKPFGPARLAGDKALPAFVGKGADASGLQFAALVRAAAPSIADKVRVHIRVADRRWDLLMDGDVTIKLPDERVEQALVELDMMETQSALLERDITTVDMRVAGRPTLGLGETALAALFPEKDGAEGTTR